MVHLWTVEYKALNAKSGHWPHRLNHHHHVSLRDTTGRECQCSGPLDRSEEPQCWAGLGAPGRWEWAVKDPSFGGREWRPGMNQGFKPPSEGLVLWNNAEYLECVCVFYSKNPSFSLRGREEELGSEGWTRGDRMSRWGPQMAIGTRCRSLWILDGPGGCPLEV